MTPTDFVARARATDPGVSAVVDEHLADYDEVLPHLLLANLHRQAEAAHESQDFVLRDSVLMLVDSALTDGDDAVGNAAAISFVEDSGWWEAGKDEYVASWPPALTAELHRQRGLRT